MASTAFSTAAAHPQKELMMNGTTAEANGTGNGEMAPERMNGYGVDKRQQQEQQQQNGHAPLAAAENGVKAKEEKKKENKAEQVQPAAAAAAKKCLTVKDWDYNEFGACGPHNWLKIADCSHLGDNQSPIDLQLSKMRILSLDSSPLCLVNYRKPLLGQLVNNGCSIQFLPDPQVKPPEIYGGKLDQNYRFIQYHFHWAQHDNEGSEHTIGGLRYPAELHLVHQGVQDPCKLAVLGIFLKLEEDGQENGQKRKTIFDDQEMEALKKLTEFDERVTLDSRHCLSSKLPANCCLDNEKAGGENFCSSFVRYQGSLTTPPCTENVIWTVFTDPLTITRQQLSLLRAVKDCRGKLIAKNYRPVQKLGNRQVHLLLAASENGKQLAK